MKIVVENGDKRNSVWIYAKCFIRCIYIYKPIRMPLRGITQVEKREKVAYGFYGYKNTYNMRYRMV